MSSHRFRTSFVLPLLILSAATASAPAAHAQVPPPPRTSHPFFAGTPEQTVAAALAKNARMSPDVALAWSRVRERELAFDVDEYGVLWARGKTYKASFAGAGATYIPFLGSLAPRNYPVRMHLASASAGGESIALEPGACAVREGERVLIDRGPIDEVYELSLEALEQTFVIEERPAGGDLRLFVAIDTELDAGERAEGFEFANELGAVRYGRASIREAGGALSAVATRLVEGGVEIVVPAAKLATATFPLVVDPVVSTFAIDTTTFDNYDPDVAYDATNDRFLVVYQETFSATDFDVYSELLDSAGTVVSGGYVQVGAGTWFLPHVANINANDAFLVVATTGDIPSTTNRHIFGRITPANTVTYGAAFDISGGATDNNLYPEVGGDPYGSAPAYFCVAWQRQVGGLRQLVFRLVDAAGVPVGADPVVLDTNFGAKDAGVSTGNGGQRWNIVWDRCPASAFDCDIWGAQVTWDGLIDTPAFSISSVPAVEYAPTPSSPLDDGSYMVIWRTENGAHYDTQAEVLLGNVQTTRENLTLLEGINVTENQFGSDVDSDGEQFVVAYSETYFGSGFDTDPYVAAFVLFGSTLAVAESHRDLAFTSSREQVSGVTSTYSTGGARKRYLAVWDEQASSGTQSDIHGALYDGPVAGQKTPYCFGDGTGTACPCGNTGAAGQGCANSANPSGARLAAFGSARVSADTVQLAGSGLPNTTTCLFFQGTAQSSGGAGTVFGDGLRCATGTIVRLATKTASFGNVSYPGAGDPSVSVRGAIPAAGGLRFYQGWYRNSAAFCTAAAFNLTNGMRITWLP